MSLLEGRQVPEEGVPVQFCPWVHLSQRWEVLERTLQQSSFTEEDHASEELLSQGTHGESQPLPHFFFFFPTKEDRLTIYST